MKKSVLSMLAVAALVFGMTSCNGAKKTSEEAEKTEEAAVIAGKAPKDLLTEELKQETIQLLKDMPDSDIPYRLSTGAAAAEPGRSLGGLRCPAPHAPTQPRRLYRLGAERWAQRSPWRRGLFRTADGPSGGGGCSGKKLAESTRY